MRNLLRASLVYGLAVFAAGFVFGAIRVVLLAPRLGDNTAVLFELPIMLMAVFFLARWAVKRWHVPAKLPARLLFGTIGFVVLMACETGLSVTLFGNTLAQHIAHYRDPEAWTGLAAQLIVIAMPALLLWLRSRDHG